MSAALIFCFCFGYSQTKEELEAEKKGNRILDLSLEWRHCCKHESLPWHHRDPFDRLLVCQALCEGLSMITKDRHIEKYEAPIIW